jgi:hypothetical protein
MTYRRKRAMMWFVIFQKRFFFSSNEPLFWLMMCTPNKGFFDTMMMIVNVNRFLFIFIFFYSSLVQNRYIVHLFLFFLTSSFLPFLKWYPLGLNICR